LYQLWLGKLDKYYALTSDIPAYVGTFVLHPAFKWQSFKNIGKRHGGKLQPLARDYCSIDGYVFHYLNLP
jgi:hypothetical protein